MKYGRKRIICWFMFLLLGFTFQASQQAFCRDEGLKYITNYSRKDYKRNIPQNWWIIQDKDGVVYVGNNGTLLIFDGVSWRSIDVPNKNVRSIAIDDVGTVYIGGNNEFGYLVPDDKGSLKYVSLIDKLKENQKNFSVVWKTYWTKQGVYFQSKEILFRWNSQKIKPWPTNPNTRFHFSYVCEGDFYIKQDNKGLMKMVNDGLELVPGGEIFADKLIYMMVPYNSKRLLIGTRGNGFYIYDGTKAVPFPTEVDDYLKEKQLYHGIPLSSPSAEPNDFALATIGGGLVIIDSQGKLKKMFTTAHGLQDNDVKYVYKDFQGNLWLALGDGISKIEYKSPISVFDKRSDLPGLVLSVIKHRNKLYAGTTNGLYYLVPPDSLESPGKFQPVPQISSNCWSLLSIGDSLFAATRSGVFQMRDKTKRKKDLVIEIPSNFLLRSGRDTNRIWVGTDNGLISLYLNAENGQGKKECGFKEIAGKIITIVEDKKGNLWLGTPTKGVIKVDFATAGIIADYSDKSYQTSHGLPEGEVNVFWAAGHTMFATVEGIYRFDEETKNFSPDNTLGKEFAGGADGRRVFTIEEDSNKNIWFYSQLRNFRANLNPDNTFTVSSKPLLRISRAQVNAIYLDPDGDAVWFGGNDGLVRFDKTVERNYDQTFKTLIRKVVISGKLFFNGYETKTNIDSKFKPPIYPINYEDRNLHFEFAAPFFEDESAIQYQYFLEGYDGGWSALTTETNKDYTNLDSGFYTFRVRAENIYKNPGREAIFQFKILTPWYKTWWAFLSFSFGLLFLVYLIIRWWRYKMLKREKQRLERIVKERTKEIHDKNQQLEEQAEKLKEMDTVKSRFFANISHEFRTPLTLIMGPLEQILSSTRSKKQKEKLNLMLRNSHRLLTLINQLLDLSRFDSGKMRLQAIAQNIIPFLKGILASFNLAAAQKKIQLEFAAEEEDITLYFDPEKLEQVICNLLSNAFKFTPARGKIAISVKKIHTKGENTPPDFLDISVSDTGIGISKDQLAHIFDRFYQARGSSGDMQVHNHKGTGIGLALAKELVNLHHGKIDVHSSKGKGTEFIIRLPMRKAHLHPDEIVESQEIPPDRKELRKDLAFSMIMEEEDEAATAQENEKDIENEKQEKNVILVVEDNADVRQYIRGALEPTYTVKEAVNGREGIDRAKELIPDLVISDIMMPEADGYELCEALKTDIKTSHIPVILLTAKASEQSMVEGLESGADDYITKPFNTKILCTRIKNLIDLRRHMQEKIQRQLVLQPVEISVSSMDDTFINEVQEAIEKNLAEPEFNVEELGKKLYMSRATLYRKIQALTGESPREFIKSYRLKRGAQLLKANFGNVTEVAFEVGFSSTAYFSKCFKEKFQQLPRTFQVSENSG